MLQVMKFIRHQVGPLCLSIALMGCLTSCHESPSQSQTKEDNVLNRGNRAEPATLDPAKVEDVSSGHIINDLFEGLTAEAPNNTIVPGVAERWNISPDFKVYTFHLRHDAKWSNGEPVTADDFVYGIRRAIDPHTASTEAYLLYSLKNAEAINAGKSSVDSLGVKALDRYTVQVTLKAVTPYILQIMANPITYPVYKPDVERWGDGFTQPGHLVSNGAYQLKTWRVNDHVTLIRNPYYWDNAHTAIDTVNYYPTVDAATELKMYQSGELDYTSTVPSDSFQRIKQTLPSELHISPWAASFYLGLNLRREALKSMKLRQALSMAIDRKTIVRAVLPIGIIPQYGILPAGMGVDTANAVPWENWTRQARLAKAQALYKAAGYSKQHPLHITILYNTDDQRKKLAIAIQAMWAQNLGVKVSLRNEDWKAYLSDIGQHNYDIVMERWVADYNDASTFFMLLTTDGTQNSGGYSNLKYDALVNEASHTANRKQMVALYEQARAIVNHNYVRIPIFQYVNVHLVKDYVGHYKQTQLLDHVYTKNWHIINRKAGKRQSS